MLTVWLNGAAGASWRVQMISHVHIHMGDIHIIWFNLLIIFSEFHSTSCMKNLKIPFTFVMKSDLWLVMCISFMYIVQINQASEFHFSRIMKNRRLMRVDRWLMISMLLLAHFLSQFSSLLLFYFYMHFSNPQLARQWRWEFQHFFFRRLKYLFR